MKSRPKPLSQLFSYCHTYLIVQLFSPSTAPDKKNKQITWVAIKNPKKLSIKIDVQGLDWDTSRSIIATACSSTYNKIARLFEDGTFSTPCKIDWFGYIFRDSNYPKDPTVLVVDPIAFSVWMNTIISTWACKGGITILMPNPQEKVVRAEKADLVAEVVRRAEARKSLAWASTSTSQDPKENPELDDF
ncbi:hypothetical protein Pst134EA_003004 [Puccinia striiformis f. sp. tritici]|uniref:hypothetical protein n=2 Tax=Puccinia striiformis f. sp. tritici TaxID=168172 RepID=UPI0020078339|nr:hypothetical protein Pst134EA_003004 [Puccinia striiformis f. sp. tritici]KAH9472386.1 hypothetical protein Pst134EA_003004 [Puccinia striiformis f. sp. tritici]